MSYPQIAEKISLFTKQKFAETCQKIVELVEKFTNPYLWLRMSAVKKLIEKLCKHFEESRQQIVERFDRIPLMLYLPAHVVKQEHNLRKIWHTLIDANRHSSYYSKFLS